jgi:hypothetical protein
MDSSGGFEQDFFIQEITHNDFRWVFPGQILELVFWQQAAYVTAIGHKLFDQMPANKACCAGH